MHPSTQFLSLRILSGAFISGIAILTGVIFFVAPDTVLPQPWVIAVLLGLVATAAVVSLVMVGQVPAASEGDNLGVMVSKVQPVHILRLALMESPVILAIVLMFLADEPSWATVAIAAVPTILLMLLLVFPHQDVLRRYERALDADGVHTRFTDKLLGAQSRP